MPLNWCRRYHDKFIFKHTLQRYTFYVKKLENLFIYCGKNFTIKIAEVRIQGQTLTYYYKGHTLYNFTRSRRLQLYVYCVCPFNDRYACSQYCIFKKWSRSCWMNLMGPGLMGLKCEVWSSVGRLRDIGKILSKSGIDRPILAPSFIQ